jgi:hypothetical protein
MKDKADQKCREKVLHQADEEKNRTEIQGKGSS